MDGQNLSHQHQLSLAEVAVEEVCVVVLAEGEDSVGEVDSEEETEEGSEEVVVGSEEGEIEEGLEAGEGSEVDEMTLVVVAVAAEVDLVAGTWGIGIVTQHNKLTPCPNLSAVVAEEVLDTNPVGSAETMVQEDKMDTVGLLTVQVLAVQEDTAPLPMDTAAALQEGLEALGHLAVGTAEVEVTAAISNVKVAQACTTIGTLSDPVIERYAVCCLDEVFSPALAQQLIVSLFPSWLCKLLTRLLFYLVKPLFVTSPCFPLSQSISMHYA